MKPRPIKAWAIVYKKKPKLHPQLIFEDNDIVLTRDEELVRVIISYDTSNKPTRRTKR